jgi:hypothetical protein
MTPLETLKQERAKYGELVTPEQAVEMLNALCYTYRLNLALCRAPAGGNGWDHPNGFVRTDKICDVAGRHIVDVFEDGPDRNPYRAGPAAPQWQIADAMHPTQWVEPVAPWRMPGAPPPPPPVEPPPPPPVEPPIGSTDPDSLALIIDNAATRICNAIAVLHGTVMQLDTRAADVQSNGIRFKLR